MSLQDLEYNMTHVNVSALQELKSLLKGSIYAQGENGYDLSKWAENAKKPAKYVVQPLTSDDISKALKFAKSEGLPVAVRSGGHGTTGASATAGGVLIDLRKLNQIEVLEAEKLVVCEAGALTHDIDLATIKYGLATTVGVCSTVGIGGYATAGGLGFATGLYGLAVDNIVKAEVVIAEGSILIASDEENSDLFWGIRGGGSNFGIVSKLWMKLHPQREDVYSINYVFLPHQLPAIVKAVNEGTEVQKPTEAWTVLMSLGPDGLPYIILMGWADAPQQEAEIFFKRFLDIGPVFSTHGQIPFDQFGTLADAFSEIKGNKMIVGADFNIFDLETVQKAWDCWLEISKKAPHSVCMYEFYPMGKVPGVAVDAMAYAQRHTDKNTLCGIMWTDPEFTPEAEKACLKLQHIVSSSSTGAAPGAIGYPNYCDVYAVKNETDEYARRLFGLNYPRLQEIKKKYDPEMLFRNWFCITPVA